MSDRTIFLIILAMGASTFFLRSFFLFLFGRVDVPRWLEPPLRYVPAAVLAAIVTPGVFWRDGSMVLLDERTVAAAVAAVIAWRTRNLLLTIVAGMAALWIGQAL